MAAWVPIAASMGGAVVSNMLREKDKSGEQYAKMLEEAKNIPLPILKQYYPEIYKEVVSLNPELETQVVLGSSATEGVSLDPRYKQAQMDALSKLMNPNDIELKADEARVLNNVNQNLKGNVDAINQNMAARGLSGGMTEMVNKQLASQNAANRQAQMELDLKAQAEQRALQRLIQQGEMARGMSSQDFSQQMQKADAQDAIARFNAANAQDLITRNVASRNNAQQFNAQQKQTMANNNVDLRNNAQQYNQDLTQRNFDNQLKRLGMSSNARQGMAESQYRQTSDNNRFWGDIINSGAQTIGKYYSTPKKKRDEEEE